MNRLAKCPVCGKEFTADRSTQIYCSAACRRYAYRHRDDRLRDEPRRQTGKILLAPLRAAVLEALGARRVPGRGAYLFLPAVRPDGDRHGSKGPANRLLQRRLPHTVVFRASEADTVGRYDKKRVRTDELRSDSFCIYNNVIYRSDRRLDEAARVC